MKIIVTGSLGYVSTPLIQQLVAKGHSVTVISSRPENQTAINGMGAKAAIGNLNNVDFITSTFAGADAVYCMLAPYGNLPTRTTQQARSSNAPMQLPLTMYKPSSGRV